MIGPSIVTTSPTPSPYRGHVIVVRDDPEHGWMTEMRDEKGKVLGEQYFVPPLSQPAWCRWPSGLIPGGPFGNPQR